MKIITTILVVGMYLNLILGLVDMLYGWHNPQFLLAALVTKVFFDPESW